MKTSLEWLSQYLPGPLDAQVAADALTNGGLPVEVIERVGDDTVIDVESHEQSPRLPVARGRRAASWPPC